VVGVLRVPGGNGCIVDSDIDQREHAVGADGNAVFEALGDGDLVPAVAGRAAVPVADLVQAGHVALSRHRLERVDFRSRYRTIGRRWGPELAAGFQDPGPPAACRRLALV